MDLIDQMFENGIDMTGVGMYHSGHDENGVSGVIYTTYTEDGERIDEFVPWEDMVQPDTYSTPGSISSMTYYQFVVLYGCARNKVGQNATPETVMNYFAQHWYTLVKERDDLWNSFPHGCLPMPVRKSEYTPPTISSMTYEESYALYQSFQTYADDEANAAFRESNLSERVARILLGIPTEYYYSMDQLNEYLANHPLEPADLTDTINNSDGPALTLNVDWEYNSIYGPGNITVNIDPEYAKQLEEQFKNVKIRLSGYGRGPALIKFIYDSDEAETPSGYELVRNELWSGSESCTDEQIADIAKFMINHSFNEQQKAMMLEAVDAFLAKGEQTSVADENPDGPTIATDYLYGPGFIVTDISTNPVKEKIMSKIWLTAFAVKDYGEGWSIIGTGDFNGNGTTDVLVANPTAASDTVGLIGYWENNEDWTLIGGYSPEWSVIATADFDGNGTTDILWRNSFVGDDGNTYNAYCTWIVDNDANWRMVSASDAAEWDFLCTGDFDGDGTKDIAMINAAGVVDVWRVVDGVMQSDSVLSVVDTSVWEFFSVGDFDDDGTDDIAWRSADGTTYGYWQIRDGQLAAWEASSAPNTVFVINTTIPGGEYLDQGATLA